MKINSGRKVSKIRSMEIGVGSGGGGVGAKPAEAEAFNDLKLMSDKKLSCCCFESDNIQIG